MWQYSILSLYKTQYTMVYCATLPINRILCNLPHEPWFGIWPSTNFGMITGLYVFQSFWGTVITQYRQTEQMPKRTSTLWVKKVHQVFLITLPKLTDRFPLSLAPMASIQIYLGQNFIWRQIDVDSLTFHAAHVPMYFDLHKQMFYIAHK